MVGFVGKYFYITNDAPQRGDLAICRFPRGAWQMSPRRAVVIVDCSDDNGFKRVRVAFGTVLASGSSSRFLISVTEPGKVKAANLVYPTWFDLRRIVSVPYTALAFDVNYRGTAIIGRLGAEELAEVNSLIGDAEAEEIRSEPAPNANFFGKVYAIVRALMQRRYPTV